MKNKTYNSLFILIILFLCISVIFPLINLIFNINIADISEIILSPQFGVMLKNSLITASLATLLSTTIAFTLAWCINRTKIKHQALISVLITIPMLIPSISHGMGLILLFGNNGIITNFLGIKIQLYGYIGIITGALLYSFPVAFLMLTDGFKYEDYTSYEAAQVLGLNKIQQFMTITLPNMKRSLISVIFAVFTMIFTDYGVPLVVGGKDMTLPVYMYREVIGLLDFSKGAIIGIILLVPAFIAFIIDLKQDEQGNSNTVTKPFIIAKNPIRDRFAYIFCGITLFVISLPIFSFAFLSVVKHYPIDMRFSFDNIEHAFELGVGSYLLNSLAIAFATSLIGLCTIYFTAFITARSKKTFTTSSIHLIAMISLAVPGVVLGLCYVLFFQGSIIYGSIAVIILVNIIHFFASPYLLAYNSLSKFSRNMEDIAVTMGISKWRMLMDIYIPCTQGTLIEIFSYLFVNSMVTISAVSFLANFSNMPLALMIPQFDSQSLIEATAFISIIILIVNIIAKLIVYIIKKNYVKKEV